MQYETHIVIDAPAATVWRVLTTQEVLQQVLGSEITTDWQVGHPITFINTWEDGQHTDKGAILAFEPNQRLALTYLPALSNMTDEPAHYQVVTCTLESQATQTVLHVRHENIQDDFFTKHALEIWGDILRSIKQVAEDTA